VLGGLFIGGGTLYFLNSSNSSHTAAGEAAWRNRETESTQYGETVTGEVTLDSGEYVGLSFWNEGVATLSISVDRVTGGAVDVWVIQDTDIDAYRNAADEVEYWQPLSEQEVTTAVDLAEQVPTGTWWVILDNSDAFGSPADDSVTVEFGAGVGL
jgi:hypothetical protein